MTVTGADVAALPLFVTVIVYVAPLWHCAKLPMCVLAIARSGSCTMVVVSLEESFVVAISPPPVTLARHTSRSSSSATDGRATRLPERSDSVPPGAEFPPIVVMANVPANASSQAFMQAFGTMQLDVDTGNNFPTDTAPINPWARAQARRSLVRPSPRDARLPHTDSRSNLTFCSLS